MFAFQRGAGVGHDMPGAVAYISLFTLLLLSVCCLTSYIVLYAYDYIHVASMVYMVGGFYICISKTVSFRCIGEQWTHLKLILDCVYLPVSPFLPNFLVDCQFLLVSFCSQGLRVEDRGASLTARSGQVAISLMVLILLKCHEEYLFVIGATGSLRILGLS